MKIVIEEISREDHRYPTCGDWFFEEEWIRPPGTEMGPSSLWQKGKILRIKVSRLEDFRHTMMVAVHELVEALTCHLDGVTQEQVDKFDMEYEANRKEGDESEPGDDPNAPYKRQHNLATAVERMCSYAWGVDWKDYESKIEALFKPPNN
jgi:hypothetical protein